MRRRRFGTSSALLGAAVVCAATVAGCGDPDPDEVKQALRDLPYRFEFRGAPTPDGASDAFRAHVSNGKGVGFEFALTLGSMKPVPVPHDAPQGFSTDPEFDYNSNAGAGQSGREFNTAIAMDVEIANAICMELLEEPCPI